MTAAKFITFEGLDGAGKTTHIAAAVRLIEGDGHRVVATREPGGTPLGERLRELVLHEQMALETEAMLMFAGRCEHLAAVIRPALAAGTWVVCDRFSDASFAYQGGGRGMSTERLAALERWVHGDLQPDLTLLFDLPPPLARERLSAARAPDRFERETVDFQVRVREAYLARARESAGRIKVIDASQTIDRISKTVEEIVVTYCLN
jgi:dTMP kinase